MRSTLGEFLNSPRRPVGAQRLHFAPFLGATERRRILHRLLVPILIFWCDTSSMLAGFDNCCLNDAPLFRVSPLHWIYTDLSQTIVSNNLHSFKINEYGHYLKINIPVNAYVWINLTIALIFRYMFGIDICISFCIDFEKCWIPNGSPIAAFGNTCSCQVVLHHMTGKHLGPSLARPASRNDPKTPLD